jgi:spire-like protein
LDLATQPTSFRPERRHSITLCETPSCNPPTEIQKSMECLSLTLEEIVHIRSVLTKADHESLAVRPDVYNDVTKEKVCFLCLKTRFSFFGPRGQKCKLCRRLVCDKCSSKMHIPTEHFASVPVYTLTPTSASGSDDDSPSRPFWQQLSEFPGFSTKTVGSAPSSPTLPTKNSMNSSNGDSTDVTPTGVSEEPPETPPAPADAGQNREDTSPSKQVKKQPKRQLLRSKTLKTESKRREQMRGSLMNVCTDCKGMVCHIILASRKSTNPNGSNSRRGSSKGQSPTKVQQSPVKLPNNSTPKANGTHYSNGGTSNGTPSRDLKLDLSPIYSACS